MKKRYRLISAAVALMVACGCSQAQTSDAISLTRLGDLGGVRDQTNQVAAVSADGRTFVGSCYSDTNPVVPSRAFSWSALTGWQRLAAPSDERSSSASAISSDGRIVTGSVAQPGPYGNDKVSAVRWLGDGSVQPLAPEAATRYFSNASVMNRDGSRIAGSYTTADGHNALFLWDSRSGFSRMTTDEDFAASAVYMNQPGDAVAGSVGNVGGVYSSRAFVWTQRAGVRLLPMISAEPTIVDVAVNVSDDGQTIAGTLGTGRTLSTPWGEMSGSEAVRWLNGGSTIERLGTLDGDNYSFAEHASADGKVIVGQSGNSERDTVRTFVWTAAGGMRSLPALLDAAGVARGDLRLDTTLAISPDGSLITGQEYLDSEYRPMFWQVRLAQSALRPVQRK
ncbi:calcium-binding protein [Burkholderia contaminans]|uniref:calcium-binding protein n=1 Tax=Burkholderia contaminans TaxID=488447 RepID=UPI0031109C1B